MYDSLTTNAASFLLSPASLETLAGPNLPRQLLGRRRDRGARHRLHPESLWNHQGHFEEVKKERTCGWVGPEGWGCAEGRERWGRWGVWKIDEIKTQEFLSRDFLSTSKRFCLRLFCVCMCVCVCFLCYRAVTGVWAPNAVSRGVWIGFLSAAVHVFVVRICLRWPTVGWTFTSTAADYYWSTPTPFHPFQTDAHARTHTHTFFPLLLLDRLQGRP